MQYFRAGVAQMLPNLEAEKSCEIITEVHVEIEKQ